MDNLNIQKIEKEKTCHETSQKDKKTNDLISELTKQLYTVDDNGNFFERYVNLDLFALPK